MNSKRALVTGGSGDIGREICLRLAAAGCHVIVHANRRRDEAQALAAAIHATGATAEVTSFDVTGEDGCRRELARLLEAGPIQVVVNNAGRHDDAPMAGMSTAQWRDIVDVNLNGFFNVTQPLLLPMVRTRWGRIVNISSVAAVLANRGQPNYPAAKAGLHGATRSLSRELASRSITVNAVAPGIVAGAMTEQAFTAEAVKALVPMGRAGNPGEVADLVVFLCSERASYITGQVIGINGGMA